MEAVTRAHFHPADGNSDTAQPMSDVLSWEWVHTLLLFSAFVPFPTPHVQYLYRQQQVHEIGTVEGAEEKKEEETDGNMQVIQFPIQEKNTDSATEFSQHPLSYFLQLTFTGKAELAHKMSIQVTLTFLLQPHDSLAQSKERWGQAAIFLWTTEREQQSRALSEAPLWSTFVSDLQPSKHLS